MNCTIISPDYVTVGVPSSAECDCTCDQECTYSLSLDGQVAQGQGNLLAFTVNSWVEALKVTCTATDENTLLTATSTKQLQVLGRAQRVWIIDIGLLKLCHMVCSYFLYSVYMCLTLAGPANVSITGPDLMSPKTTHTYSCHAYCRPSCSYAWRTDKGPWISGQGNVISITPQEEDSPKILICKAINRVSGMFVTANRNIAVICK